MDEGYQLTSASKTEVDKQSLHDWVKERSAYRKKTDELVTME